jgi:hypothetical protein
MKRNEAVWQIREAAAMREMVGRRVMLIIHEWHLISSVRCEV